MHFGRCLKLWQINLERRSAIQFAVNPNAAAALPHNSVHGRKPEARAFAFFFGGKERLEYSRARFFAHANARIAYSQHHVIARLYAEVTASIFAIQFYIRR